MSWNYRIIDHRSHLALHEVHYDRRGRVTHWSAEPTTFVGDCSEGAAGLAGNLARALSDALNRPVLMQADLPDG
ncbi:MAG: hypothetical protein U9R07_12815 [Pseudomonadota bacterium]|nr:hypothetical protein [Pseudomonadota bacterium]